MIENPASRTCRCASEALGAMLCRNLVTPGQRYCEHCIESRGCLDAVRIEPTTSTASQLPEEGSDD
jgi:hypothetical protein